MIVYTMTEDELLSEVIEDFKSVVSISNDKDKKVANLIRKRTVFPVRFHSFVTTKRKNNWIILWEALSRSNVGDKALISFVCYYDTPHGKYAIMPSFSEGNIVLLMFPPHFFSRFANRSGINLTGKELIKRYFEVNYNFGFSYNTDPDGTVNVYGSSKEGIALGIEMKALQMILFKTFITYDMCLGQQVEIFAQTNQIREEMHNQERFVVSDKGKLLNK